VAPTTLVSLKQPSPALQLSNSAPEIAGWKYRLAFAAIAAPVETIVEFFEAHRRTSRVAQIAGNSFPEIAQLAIYLSMQLVFPRNLRIDFAKLRLPFPDPLFHLLQLWG
jgi:hypothetical protein